ncbi:hypothetical protein [Streptomyces sp. SID13031]|uniref:hypothetical protein n=1 Tax=Streptomyces sp. SID13031 TaxID=2706046 RepID=UPI0013CB2238|nr:hypothetical protein [Streptomyces sp. SID13031]NEA36408.1 hypothetical protein [Streptomyces sp. SID13031]
MADTDDDEQTTARRPKVPARGAELAAQRAEADREQVDEELELDALEERELRDTRRQVERDSDAELADAMRRADVAERNHSYLRARAADERLLGHDEIAQAARLRDGATGRDDPQSAADLLAAERAQARADSRYRSAADDDRRADWNSAEAREQRSRAEQPPAAEAVRNAPEEPPVARKNLKRQRRLKDQDPKALRNFGIGD